MSVDLRAGNGAQVRLWLLQLGADPVDASHEAEAEGLPRVPQRAGVPREEVADFVHALKGNARDRAARFDDHGSGQSWPRGSF